MQRKGNSREEGRITKIWGACLLAAAFGGFSVWNYRRHMPGPQALGETRYRVNVRELSFAANGRRIYGELLLPEGKTGRLPTVICSHGYGSGYKLCKNMIGKSLCMSGYAVYCFDFCGGSRRCKSDWSMMQMSVFTEKEDLLAVVEKIRSLREVDTDRVYLLGESQGGIVSAMAAAECGEKIRAMVLYYPAFCIPEDAQRKFAQKEDIPDVTRAFGLQISKKYYEDVWDFDVFSEIGRYTGPVLILHGDRDKTVDISYGERGAKAYPNARFVRMPGEIHGFYGKGKKEAARQSFAFLQEQEAAKQAYVRDGKESVL